MNRLATGHHDQAALGTLRLADVLDWNDVDLRRGRVLLVGSGSKRFNPIHGRDLVRVCVEAALSNEREVEAGGPDVFTQVEVAELAFRMVGKPVKLEFKVHGDIPLVEADETKFRQVIINLISNSAKFTEQGGIVVRLKHDQDDVVIRVSDTGIGIDKQELETVFQPFRQIDGSAAKGITGTGLGLSLAKEFIEMLGGSIHADSEIGTGTTFTIRLPIQQETKKKKSKKDKDNEDKT